MADERALIRQTEQVVAKWNERFKRPRRSRLHEILARLRRLPQARFGRKRVG